VPPAGRFLKKAPQKLLRQKKGSVDSNIVLRARFGSLKTKSIIVGATTGRPYGYFDFV
jgi:hypothetical protein